MTCYQGKDGIPGSKGVPGMKGMAGPPGPSGLPGEEGRLVSPLYQELLERVDRTLEILLSNVNVHMYSEGKSALRFFSFFLFSFFHLQGKPGEPGTPGEPGNDVSILISVIQDHHLPLHGGHPPPLLLISPLPPC